MSDSGLSGAESSDAELHEMSQSGEELNDAETNDSGFSDGEEGSGDMDVAHEAATNLDDAEDDAENDAETVVMELEATGVTEPKSNDAGEVAALSSNFQTPPMDDVTLLEKALAAVAQRGKSRSSHTQGDMVVVLDATDLTKTLIFDSKVVAGQIPHLVDLYELSTVLFECKTSEAGVKYLVVLEESRKVNDVPRLEVKSLSTPAPFAKVAVVSKAKKRSDAVTVKNEDVDNADAQQQRHQRPGVDWVKSYDCFFRILVCMPSISLKQVRLLINAIAALPSLEGVVAIAERYKCIETIGAALKSLSNDWISHHKLYVAIESDPTRWLLLAIKLRSGLVYKEAFVHLVGRLGVGHHPDLSGPVDELPQTVASAIMAQSRELKIEQYEINQQLLTITLKVRLSGNRSEASIDETVSQSHAPVVYNSVNLWRDWIAEHLSYIHSGTPTDRASLRATHLCTHPCEDDDAAAAPECLSQAGFYRVLHRGGDAYLPVEDVIAGWKRSNRGHEKNGEEGFAFEAGTVRKNLAALKAQAQKLVRPLVASMLRLDASGLRYVTCVEVGRVPWAGEGEGDSEDDEESFDEEEEEEDGDIEMRG